MVKSNKTVPIRILLNPLLLKGSPTLSKSLIQNQVLRKLVKLHSSQNVKTTIISTFQTLSIFGRCLFYAFGYDNDLHLLDKTMSSLDSVSKESIPNLAPGQVILTGVLFDLSIIIQVDPCKKIIYLLRR